MQRCCCNACPTSKRRCCGHRFGRPTDRCPRNVPRPRDVWPSSGNSSLNCRVGCTILRTRHDSRDLGTGPVDFLIRQLPSQLAAVLENELPQTIAAALLGLPANQAADVLAHLSFEQQDAVACRLAEMGCVSDDTLQYLAESLAEQVAAAAQTPVERGDGPQHLRAILDYSDQATRDRLTVTVQASGLPWTQSARDLRESA